MPQRARDRDWDLPIADFLFRDLKIEYVYFSGKGREYGTWIDTIDASARSNHSGIDPGYDAGDLIENPIYIVESVCRTEGGFDEDDIDLVSFDVAGSAAGNGGDLAKIFGAIGSAKYAFSQSEAIGLKSFWERMGRQSGILFFLSGNGRLKARVRRLSDGYLSSSAKNVSTCENRSGGALGYESFSGASATGFTAENTSDIGVAGTADEISFIGSKKYQATFTLATIDHNTSNPENRAGGDGYEIWERLDVAPELMPNQVDRDFSGPSAWTNVSWGIYDETDDLHLVAGVSGTEYCTLPVASAPMTAGNRYKLEFDLSGRSGDVTISDFTGLQVFGTLTGNGRISFVFTVDGGITGGLRITGFNFNDGGLFDNFSLTRIVAPDDPTEFHASNRTGYGFGGTADEIQVVVGSAYRVTFDMAKTSGTMPVLSLLQAHDGGEASTTEGNDRTIVEGSNIFTWTALSP